jgi:lysozyme
MIDNIQDQLIRDEGEKLVAYQDHLGYWTIGVGRLIDGRKGGGISKIESRYLLTNDISTRDEALKRLIPWSASLSPQRFGVLLNMSFQMGVEGLLGFKNTLAMVRQGQYTQASLGMLQSLWAKQTPERAWRLSEQMRTGEWK